MLIQWSSVSTTSGIMVCGKTLVYLLAFLATAQLILAEDQPPPGPGHEQNDTRPPPNQDHGPNQPHDPEHDERAFFGMSDLPFFGPLISQFGSLFSGNSSRLADANDHNDTERAWSISFSHHRLAGLSNDSSTPQETDRLFFGPPLTIRTTCNSTTEGGVSCANCSYIRFCYSNNQAILRRCLFGSCINNGCRLFQPCNSTSG